MPWRIILFLLITLSAVACCRQEDLKLHPAALAWLPVITGQDIIFKNEAGREIVFKATERKFEQSAHDKVCGAYTAQTVQTILTTSEAPGLQIVLSASYEVILQLQVHQQSPQTQGMAVQFNTVSKHFVSDAWQDKRFAQLNLNGKTFQEALLVHAAPVNPTLPITKIYYGQGLGLIGFYLNSGDWYYRQ